MTGVDRYRCHTFQAGEPRSEAYLEKYLAVTDVENNKTRKALRVDVYDGTNGVLHLLIDEETDSPMGVTSSVKYDEGGILSAKVWHRLHLMDGVPRAVIDRFFEPATFAWCQAQGIQRLWVTFNEPKPRIASWAAARMGERRNTFRPNPYVEIGAEIRKGWRPHDKLIFERYVWQYVIYYSPDGKFFLERPEKDLDKEMCLTFCREFPSATQFWNRN